MNEVTKKMCLILPSIWDSKSLGLACCLSCGKTSRGEKRVTRCGVLAKHRCPQTKDSKDESVKCTICRQLFQVARPRNSRRSLYACTGCRSGPLSTANRLQMLSDIVVYNLKRDGSKILNVDKEDKEIKEESTESFRRLTPSSLIGTRGVFHQCRVCKKQFSNELTGRFHAKSHFLRWKDGVNRSKEAVGDRTEKSTALESEEKTTDASSLPDNGSTSKGVTELIDEILDGGPKTNKVENDEVDLGLRGRFLKGGFTKCQDNKRGIGGAFRKSSNRYSNSQGPSFGNSTCDDQVPFETHQPEASSLSLSSSSFTTSGREIMNYRGERSVLRSPPLWPSSERSVPEDLTFFPKSNFVAKKDRSPDRQRKRFKSQAFEPRHKIKDKNYCDRSGSSSSPSTFPRSRPTLRPLSSIANTASTKPPVHPLSPSRPPSPPPALVVRNLRNSDFPAISERLRSSSLNLLADFRLMSEGIAGLLFENASDVHIAMRLLTKFDVAPPPTEPSRRLCLWRWHRYHSRWVKDKGEKIVDEDLPIVFSEFGSVLNIKNKNTNSYMKEALVVEYGEEEDCQRARWILGDRSFQVHFV